MNRDSAIRILAEDELRKLTPEERADLLCNWWSIDAEDPEYHELPEALQAELDKSGDPPESEESGDPRYDPFLLMAIAHRFIGVTNSYLQKRLSLLGSGEPVEGDVELLECCPCCGCRSIDSRGEYDICRVCFWEDDGSEMTGKVSAANRMSIATARQNFARWGACSEEARDWVLPDGLERYVRDCDLVTSK